MKSDNKWLLYGFIVLIILNVILLGYIFAGMNGVKPSLSPPTANSILKSDLYLQGAGTNGVLFSSNDLGSLTITPDSGVAKINADLTLAKGNGGTVLKTNELGSFIVTPSSGYTKIESDLTLTKVGYTGGVVLSSNNLGSLTVTPQSGASKFVGDLSVTNLGGTGNAYACINSVGKLYRSLIQCR